MLRNLNQVISGRRVLDIPKTGVLGSLITPLGSSSYIYDDVQTGGLSASEVRGRIESTTLPSANWSADNRAQLQFSGVADGLYSFTYRLYIFGVPQGLVTEPLLVGNPAPILIVQPSNTSVPDSSRAQFVVGAYGAGLNFQWQISTSANGPWTNVTTGSGATGSVFSTGPVSLSGATPDTTGKFYRVLVTNGVGSVASTPAMLTVTPSVGTIPSFVGTITVSAVTTSSYTLSWPTATDDGTIVRYEYSLNHGAWTSVGNVTTTNFTGRTYGTVDLVEIRAIDNDGNASSPIATTIQLLNLSVGLVGPSTGTVAIATSNFIASVNGSYTGTLTVIPSDGGQGGSFTPGLLQMTSGSSVAFVYTPVSTGTKSITITNNRGFSNPTTALPLVVGAAAPQPELTATTLATLLDVRTYSADSNVRRSTAAFSLNYPSFSGLSSQNMAIEPAGSKVYNSTQSRTQITVLRTSIPLTVTVNFRDGTNTTRTVNKLLIMDDDVASLVMANGSTTATAQVTVLQG